MTRRSIAAAALLAAVATISMLQPTPALATNGYFTHGVGLRAQGMAGVSIALPQDALAAANNPAGTALVGDRFDLEATWFRPDRGARISGNGFGADGSYDGNDDAWFLLPALGYTKRLDHGLSWGVALYGNGGMNTGYESNPFAAYGGTGTAGVDLAQVFLTPSLAWRHGRHSIGVAVTGAYQRFEARGLGPFDNPVFSSRPGAVTDLGHDESTGWGVKIGWHGQLTPTLALGATWSSKLSMEEFDDYAGLFADGGSFDIPETYGAGLSWQATPALTLAADWQHIRYDDIPAVANSLAPLLSGVPLGADGGPGFGWEDRDVWKLGARYRVGETLTLRAGYSTMDQPIPANETFINILAPGVIEEHASIGASWRPRGDEGGEWTFAYTRALENTVRGSGSIPPAFGGGEADLTMHQDILAVGYSWRF
jgi:long-chain fatty acid transport protein